MRARGTLALAIFAATFFAARPIRAQEDTVLVEAVVRVDIEYGPSEVLPAFAVDSRLLLPLMRLLDNAELGVSDSALGQFVSTVLRPAGIPVRFDTDSMRLTMGDSVVPIGRWDAVWSGGELFVATDLLTEAFGVVVGMDWIGLTAVIGHTEGLPVARRVRRERARVRAARRQPAFVEAMQVPVPQAVADGAVVEFALTGATNDPFGSGSARIGVGANLLGGSLEFRHDRFRFAGGSVSETRASWMRAWPERRWVRQIRIGDVQSAGRRSRLIRGAAVTNQPFIRSSEFDLEEIVGEVPAGWEVELYDAYGLLDFGEADPQGGFRVAVPLRYGQNPFDMVLYGPRGEVIRRRRTIRVPFSRIPDREIEYAVGIGKCQADPCGAAFTADVRYGVSRNVTAQAGWDLMSRSGESALWQPYVAVSAGVLPSVSVTAEAVANGLLRAQADYEPSPDLRVRVAQTFFDADGAVFVGAPLDRRRSEGSLVWFRRGRLATTVQLSGSRSSGPGATRTFLRALVSARKSGGRYAVDLRHSRVTLSPAVLSSLTLLDLNGDMVFSSGPAWLRSSSIGGGVGLAFQKGLESIRARVGRPVMSGVRAEFGLGWFRTEGLVIDIGLTTTLAGPRFSSRNRFTTGAGTQGMQFIDGSLLWDRRAGNLQLGDGRDVGRAGLAGSVFVDLDGDGVWDGDEPGLEGVPVRVGGRLTETDEFGRFSVWELVPFEPALIEVDTTEFVDPFLTVPNRVVEIVPSPNSFVPVEIPVVVGAEVSGGVLLDGEPLAGVRVQLRNRETGRTSTLVTFADGGFYTIGVPPGDYEVAIPDYVLRGLGATSIPVPITVPVGAGEKIIEAVVVTIERR